MPSTKELRRRIRSVKNTAQITKAMQMVAATKMRRAQNQALGGRPYSETLQKAVAELMPAIDQSLNPLLRENNSDKIGILLLTTDKSLCGALNSNVLRLAQQFCNGLRHPEQSEGYKETLNPKENKLDSRLRGNDKREIEFFTIGKKGRDFVVKTGKELVADFENSDTVSYTQAKQTANVLIQSFLEGKIGEVYILYPDFVSTLKQDPKLEKILPISRDDLLKGLNLGDLTNKKEVAQARMTTQQDEFIFDTTKSELLNFVLNHFVQQKVFQSLLETKASEHSARMIAMKNATDSAKDLVSDLQLAYNQTRQEGITRELLEITSALAALE
jgi:F-type H+-transporting ATPase subunit gamma